MTRKVIRAIIVFNYKCYLIFIGKNIYIIITVNVTHEPFHSEYYQNKRIYKLVEKNIFIYIC